LWAFHSANKYLNDNLWRSEGLGCAAAAAAAAAAEFIEKPVFIPGAKGSPNAIKIPCPYSAARHPGVDDDKLWSEETEDVGQVLCLTREAIGSFSLLDKA
jgi:hypothetical protein